MKKLILASLVVVGAVVMISQSAHALPGALPSTYGLKEGDVVGASAYGDPDLFIINTYGYKRLFLNPKIFSFYGHLGGFAKVKPISATARDQFETSLLFRNCETNDQRVFALEVSGEDTGTLHHLNMSGSAAVQQDPQFFNKIFCINNNEYNWYTKGAAYTSLSQVPVYNRSYGTTSQTNACRGFEVRPPVFVSGTTNQVTFSLSTTGCTSGVAIEVASQTGFTNKAEVGRVYASGEQSIKAAVPFPAGQQLYYRVVDLANNRSVVFNGQSFVLPGTPTPTPNSQAVITYTYFDTNIPFRIQHPGNLCATQDIATVVIHDYSSPCGGNNSVNTTTNYMLIYAFPLGVETTAELKTALEEDGVTVLSDTRTIGGYQALRYYDDELYGWAFVTNNTMTVNGQNYRYTVITESNWGTVPNAVEAENMILSSFTISP